MHKVFIIRKIITALVAISVLTWAFPRNQFFGKIIISPFLICSIAFLGENVFLLFNKEKISNVFRWIFRMSFFVYAFGFLAFAFYYSIVNKEYSLIIIIVVLLIFALISLRAAFLRKK